MDLINVDFEEKEYKGFSKLNLGLHEIVKFRLVNNKFYDPKDKEPGLKKTLLVELIDQVLFMPTYISEKFNGKNEEKIAEWNNNGEKKYLLYSGKIGR